MLEPHAQKEAGHDICEDNAVTPFMRWQPFYVEACVANRFARAAPADAQSLTQ